MANRLEDKIRDYLADHLELLETGLQFVDKEYELASSLGAGGRIDILARDICGNVVVIEIKRSDQAARDALHEIHKYIALFRISQGLDESRIRLIVVSTEWHELRVPLSVNLQRQHPTQSKPFRLWPYRMEWSHASRR